MPLSLGVFQLLELERPSFLSLQAELLRVESWLLSRLVLVGSVGTTGRRVKGMWVGRRYFMRCNYILGSFKKKAGSVSQPSGGQYCYQVNAAVMACSTDLSSNSAPLGEKSASELIQAVGRIHFLAVAGLRSHFLAGCQLGACLSSLSTPIPTHGPPLSSSQQWHADAPHAPNLSDFLFCHQLVKDPAFRGSHEYTGLS